MLILKDKNGRRRAVSALIRPDILEIADDASSRFLIQQVTDIEKDFASYVTQGLNYPQLCQVDTIKDGFDYHTYRQKVSSGEAQFISRSETNFPVVNNKFTTHTQPVIPIGIAYTINFFESQKAVMYGVNLDDEGNIDCAEYIDNKLEEAWHRGGSNEEGLETKGIFDYLNGGTEAKLKAGASIHKIAATAGETSGETLWADMSGREIYKDIARGIRSVTTNSRNTKRCDTVVWGLDAAEAMADKTVVDENGSVRDLVTYLPTAFPQIKNWILDPYLDSIKFKGVSETFDGEEGSGVVLFYDSSPTNIRFKAVNRRVLTPYEHKALATKVNTYGLCGGLQVRNTFFATYLKGRT